MRETLRQVLIVSPDPVMRAMLAAVLVGTRHPIAEVTDPAQAWSAVSLGPLPGLVIVDDSLPGEAAWDLCRELRSLSGERGEIYVVVISQAAASVATQARARAVHADQIIPHASDPDVLSFLLAPAVRLLAAQRRALLAEAVNDDLALRDALTGLWSRAAILEILNREVERTQREGGRMAVLMVDLDDFKGVSDTHGHRIGDEVLREIGGRLMRAGRRCDLFGRYGGDEFLVVLPGCDLSRAQAVAKRLRERVIQEPVLLPDLALHVDLSVGVTAWLRGPVSAGELIDLADRALYRVKASGQGGVAALPHVPRPPVRPRVPREDLES